MLTRSRRPAASRASDAASFGASPGARASISVADRALGEAREGDELAARPDRLGQRAEVVGDEDDDGVRRRLLEVLEQRVGGVLVHRLGAVDEVDAAVGLERPHVQVAAELADVVDADLVADRLDAGRGRDARRARRGRGLRSARRRTRWRRARLPTPDGPWKRYACAGPRRRAAARSRRFASACSGMLSKTFTDLLCDHLGRAVAVAPS